eukprot:scpid50007/ scgid7381/ Transmembrane protein 163; Synaptic vesicle membrane protein of 31 kDa
MAAHYGTSDDGYKFVMEASSAVQGEQDLTTNEYHCISADDDDPNLSPNSPHSGRSSGRLERYQRYAIWLCMVSLGASLSLGVMGFVGSVKTDNDAAFGFALNCVLDFISTLVVLWRFWPQVFGRQRHAAATTDCSFHSPTDLLAGQQQARGQVREWWLRERRATIGIAILFVLAFVAIVCKALADIINGEVPSSGLPTVILAGISAAVFLVLAWVKVKVARVLQSPALRSDGMNSLGGTVISIGVLVSWFVRQHHPHVWYVDAFFALLVGLGMFVYAIRMLIVMMAADNRNTPVY